MTASAFKKNGMVKDLAKPADFLSVCKMFAPDLSLVCA